MILGILAVVFIFVVTLCWYVNHKYTYWHRRRVPYDKPSFPYGNLRGWRKTKHLMDIINPMYMKNRKMFTFSGLYMYLRPVLLCTNLALAKHVLISDFFNFERRGIFSNARRDTLTGELFRLDGANWHRLRGGLTSVFSPRNLELMFPAMCDLSFELAVTCKYLADNTVGNIVEMSELVDRYTSDIIGNCVFGVECNGLRESNAEFYIMGQRARMERRHGNFLDGLMDCYPKLSRKFRFRQTHPEIANYYSRIVRETVAEREQFHIRRDDIMNSLMEMKRRKELTLEEITAQALSFYISGIDSTSSTLTFALYELAKQPHIQNFLRDELTTAIETQGEFNYSACMHLKYMELVIAETLRKYPTLTYISRIARYRYSPPTNRSFYIDAGQKIIIPIYAIHHDPDLYVRPEVFMPERFTIEGLLRRPVCAWLPFGDGQRKCIGMRFGKLQISIALAYLLQNFRFSICPRTVPNIEFDKSSVLLKPKSKIFLKMEPL